MGALRKTVSSNLGDETDKDLINYVGSMEKKGINNSKLIKQALRFYRDYGDKVKKLDTVDIANILDNPQVKEYIGNIVGDLFKSAMPDSDLKTSGSVDVKKIKEEKQKKDIDSVESDYMKRLSCVKDMSL
ncbi:hypothetical protein [Clostridium estertheticum]|uniref:Uncharacterized protein n=2 Tax=Clostridium estertheticum TaxID=238834 RepID=A0A1J0GNH8_9CLOT|nr:hypothetical protein [Clostridium estertheticum]APC42486.1 hypothetical protein A7L45_21825 [Clostridium estertheticum subsp. estertheticum]MBU3075625.1 hypothetical protein [Clostridium estertheticum]MBU3164793.1 hypothetical protein [Clostridium estertheticum]MBU3173693.1 hypothetical protein [Clostridium estertheticum]MBU3187550.1 hypothetical protein [Clostridium estertheticum]